MGSIGGKVGQSRWYELPPEKRPEAGLLKLRKSLGLFCNLRPAHLYPELRKACPLRESIAEQGFDVMMVRELTGGLYFGARKTEIVDGEEVATDSLVYHDYEIRRIAKKAFEIAEKRHHHVTSVDKANVLDSSRLWRKIVTEVGTEHPGVQLDHALVDSTAMQLVRNPGQFDVVVTENMFGDILSDEASMVTGSIGMLSSASLNETKFGMYEPSHGSAPDIAGKNLANPIATVLSAAMMLRYSFDMAAEAEKGILDVWSFGPMLLDGEGRSMHEFDTTVAAANPRTAIGYYEPGHYCFVAADGRGCEGSSGCTMEELSKLFEDLGCAAAYNLDGGQSSVMVWNSGSMTVNSPANGGRPVSDIIYIPEE